MNVSAVIVTRGDVDLTPILDSLPVEWEVVEWNNGDLERRLYHPGFRQVRTCMPIHADIGVYGRYGAIDSASHDLIYVQDDDCIVSDPAALLAPINLMGDLSKRNFVVANMPERYRSDFYSHHCLVGFGAVFHRSAPRRAFDKLAAGVPHLGLANYGWWIPGGEKFNATCDVAFTALTPRVLVDVPKTDLPHYDASDRMWKQPEHVADRKRMLELAMAVSDR